METLGDILECQRLLEKRFEAACQHDGWIASASILFGDDKADFLLEKFSKEPLSSADEKQASESLKAFLTGEFPDVTSVPIDRVQEKIPQTLSPFHIVYRVRLGVDKLTINK